MAITKTTAQDLEAPIAPETLNPLEEVLSGEEGPDALNSSSEENHEENPEDTEEKEEVAPQPDLAQAVNLGSRQWSDHTHAGQVALVTDLVLELFRENKIYVLTDETGVASAFLTL